MSRATCDPVSPAQAPPRSNPHRTTDTGDRPYRCHFCPDQFARSDLLSRHVNKCHEAEKPPAGPPGRKGSRAALRATTSKQTCDQCVKSSLSCDGAKPCARCTQRKTRCTFVEFNRQTAPAGPGHPHDASSLSSSSHAPAQPPPFSTTALSREHFPVTAPPFQPNNLALDLLPDIKDVQHIQQQFLADTSPLWNQGFYQNTGGLSSCLVRGLILVDVTADNDLQHFVSNISRKSLFKFTLSTLTDSLDRRRGSLEYGGSVGSGSIPSSASSSSSHLPIEDIPIQQSFQLNTTYDTYHPPPEDTHAPFHSAFGVLSIHDPDAAPFFSNLQPQSELHSQQGTNTAIFPNMVGIGMIGDPNATPMSRDDLTWTQLMNSSTPVNLSHATPTPTGFQARRRATSMFNVRTPIAVPEAFFQTEHGAHPPQPNHRLQAQHDQFQHQLPQQLTYGTAQPIHAPVPVDLSSWCAKIQSQRPPELRLAAAKVKARRQTLAGGEREGERSSQLLHPAAAPALANIGAANAKPNITQDMSFTAYRDSASPVDPHTRSSSSSTASWDSNGTESGMRPSFKRLPSATPLEHDRERKRVTISHSTGAGDGVVPKIEDGITMPLEERKHVLMSYVGSDVGSDSGEGVVPKIEDTESMAVQLGKSTAGPVLDNRRVVNLAERRKRASVDAGGGIDMTFNLSLGTL
ncbi:hypothetical protein C0995_008131 [Termitomyces sp. Mi166|nr:hypothetical protein C0995_008131 [Termitomyces sp. Mi166\